MVSGERETHLRPLRDRYLLQGVRALFSLGRYAECVELWEKEGIRLPEDNLMRQMLLPYIAGAEFHTNHTEKALCYFAELGDVQSMLYCAGRKDEDLSVVDALEMVCDYAPNSSYIEKTLQTYIRKLEPMGEYYWEDNFEVTPELQKLYSLCLKMARSGRSNNPALWYYTASFLLDLNSEYSKASELLTLAEKSKSTDFIDESIKVFRIYLDAKVRVYDASYDSRLLAQLRWLDSKICNNIDDKVRDYTAYGYKLCRNESYYYWNDMMRRILLAELCPRMIKAGRPIRALQLANMADNRLLALVDRADSQTMAEYRNSENHNFYDYNRSFFEMIDSLGVNTAIAYLQNVRNPKNEFDRFLNERGYVADDYLNDIVGTQLLRNMRYAEAVKYLGAVGVACRNQLNVYMFYDPFCINPTPIKTNSDFRYDFAVEMYSIEQSLKMTTDPDRRAKLMYRYAIGLRNSFDRCWGITHYYKGESYWAQVDKKRDWSKADYTKTALKKADELIAAACDIVTDDELAAEIHYELCHFKTVAEMYPNTPQGILVRGNCDNIRDYKVNYR